MFCKLDVRRKLIVTLELSLNNRKIVVRYFVNRAPEVQNVSKRRWRRTEPGQAVTCTRICGYTRSSRVMLADRHAEPQARLTQYCAPLLATENEL